MLNREIVRYGFDFRVRRNDEERSKLSSPNAINSLILHSPSGSSSGFSIPLLTRIIPPFPGLTGTTTLIACKWGCRQARECNLSPQRPRVPCIHGSRQSSRSITPSEYIGSVADNGEPILIENYQNESREGAEPISLAT